MTFFHCESLQYQNSVKEDSKVFFLGRVKFSKWIVKDYMHKLHSESISSCSDKRIFRTEVSLAHILRITAVSSRVSQHIFEYTSVKNTPEK